MAAQTNKQTNKRNAQKNKITHRNRQLLYTIKINETELHINDKFTKRNNMLIVINIVYIVKFHAVDKAVYSTSPFLNAR